MSFQKRFEFNLYTMKWMKCTKDIKVQTTLEIHDHFQDKTQYYTFFAAIIHQVRSTFASFNSNSVFRVALMVVIIRPCVTVIQNGFYLMMIR